MRVRIVFATVVGSLSTRDNSFVAYIHDVKSKTHGKSIESTHFESVGFIAFWAFSFAYLYVCSPWGGDGIGPSFDIKCFHQFVSEGYHRKGCLPLCPRVDIHAEEFVWYVELACKILLQFYLYVCVTVFYVPLIRASST